MKACGLFFIIASNENSSNEQQQPAVDLLAFLISEWNSLLADMIFRSESNVMCSQNESELYRMSVIDASMFFFSISCVLFINIKLCVLQLYK